jgi:hypothetical protein
MRIPVACCHRNKGKEKKTNEVRQPRHQPLRNSNNFELLKCSFNWCFSFHASTTKTRKADKILQRNDSQFCSLEMNAGKLTASLV